MMAASLPPTRMVMRRTGGAEGVFMRDRRVWKGVLRVMDV
jgi:hypothetical protein